MVVHVCSVRSGCRGNSGEEIIIWVMGNLCE